jgi:hypothetical protein
MKAVHILLWSVLVVGCLGSRLVAQPPPQFPPVPTPIGLGDATYSSPTPPLGLGDPTQAPVPPTPFGPAQPPVSMPSTQPSSPASVSTYGTIYQPPPAIGPAPPSDPLPPRIAPPTVPVDPGPGGQRAYWSAGVGLYFIMPFYTSNPAFISQNISGKMTQTEFGQTINAAPLVWLGFTFDNGWGVRVRWFDYESSTHTGATADGNTAYSPAGTATSLGNFGSTDAKGAIITAGNRLSMNVFDIEATETWNSGRWYFLASAGIRYAHIGQDYFFSDNDILNGQFISASNSFTGAGPTVSLDFRRQIYDTNFFLYGSVRGSILFGASHQSTTSTVPPIPDPNASSGIVVPVGEIEIGAEWCRCIGRGKVFAQIAFVGQCWWGVGNASQANPLSFDNITMPGSNLGFCGGVARVGFEF